MTLRNTLIAVIILFIIILGFFYFSTYNKNPLEIDASNIKVDIVYTDMDEIIFKSDSIILMGKHHLFKKEMKDIYDYQLGYCLRIGDVDDTSFYNSIIQYRSDSSIQRLESEIRSSFSNFISCKEIITDGFRHLRFHFPKGKQPENIVFLNSLFQMGVCCTENEIGVGMEWFLGDSIINQLPYTQSFFTWMKKGMNNRYLERDIITAWIETHYLDPVEGSLVDHIIHWGKVLYLTEASYPNFDVSVILRYSKEDYKWALENEFKYWKYLVDQNLLFKIDQQMINNMVREGPFTAGIPDQDSPDRLGQFLGYRMVKNYMNNNEITLKDMLNLPYNEILQAFKIEDK